MPTHHLIKTAALTLVATAVLTSCIADEALNTECDIERAWLELEHPTLTFFSAGDADRYVPSTDSQITFTVRPGADVTALAPHFQITEGATIEPASGTVRDFSQGPLTYTLTSQDGRWTRTYQVAFKEDYSVPSTVTEYDFSKYEAEPNGKYYLWYEYQPVLDEQGATVDERYDCWASGNPGFMIAKSSAQPLEYPTVPHEAGGVDGGPFVELQTRDTGPFGKMAGMRLAAGNLFIGTFDAQYALKDAMQATCFGLPFKKKPLRLTGWYQFQRGATFQDEKGTLHPEILDLPDVYGVLYRNVDETGASFVLHGDDVLSSDNIVALARIADAHECDEWTFFDLPFVYRQELDEEILAERGYSLSIVFSSSVEGASFRGAIGSILYIDNVTLYCEE